MAKSTAATCTPLLKNLYERVTATSTPSLKDLYEDVTPQYAASWRTIGILLRIPPGTLDTIEHDNHCKAVNCCNAMFEKWLEIDSSASWECLFKAIESPAVKAIESPTVNGDQEHLFKAVESLAIDGDQTSNKTAISTLSERTRKINIKMWSHVDEDAWPPNQPKHYLPLLLIHHQGEYTPKHLHSLAAVKHGGGIDEITSQGHLPKYSPLTKQESLTELFAASKITKQISEILAPLEKCSDSQFILIEGLPGIGKSLLLQEISCKWSNENLLPKFKLVLLIRLRDPSLQGISTISKLLHNLCCEGDEGAKDIVTLCNDYLFKNAGEDLLFLFDGYDEFPENLRKDSLIASILKRKVLPLCGLIVSSRPHASVDLRQQATIKVDILGFAHKERTAYIKESLEGQPEKIEELTKYLDNHLTINGLCFTPFNMIVLLHLCKVGCPFPSSPVELVNHFILSSIRQNLSKAGHPLDDSIKDLSELPKQYSKIIDQLAELSYNALNDNKLIFTFDEINSAYPDIAIIPNGFGLLQAVQHFMPTGKTMTFNFVHFSIQEYLAAYYVARLPQREQKEVLQERFWSDVHANMFSIYTSLALTKGQPKPLKEFLKQETLVKFFKSAFSGGSNDSFTISSKFLKDQLKCLRLFRYFLEAGDDFKATCDFIQSKIIFEDQEINLGGIALTIYDVECVSLFLTNSSHKTWKMVSLHGCLIRDNGLCMLQRGLVKSKNKITIKELRLQCNALTKSSSSCISNIAIHCKVKQLVINGNHTIGESSDFYKILSDPASNLKRLHMKDISLSSKFTIVLFTELAKNNRLQCLEISNNPITDDAGDTIATTMQKNTTLSELWMWGTKFTAAAAERCAKELVDNDNLEKLYLPLYSDDNQRKIQCMQDKINEARVYRACCKQLIIKFN